MVLRLGMLEIQEAEAEEMASQETLQEAGAGAGAVGQRPSGNQEEEEEEDCLEKAKRPEAYLVILVCDQEVLVAGMAEAELMTAFKV